MLVIRLYNQYYEPATTEGVTSEGLLAGIVDISHFTLRVKFHTTQGGTRSRSVTAAMDWMPLSEGWVERVKLKIVVSRFFHRFSLLCLFCFVLVLFCAV